MQKKSYDGSPILYIVPTPLGNLEDITLRSIRILGEVDAIFCEDTRTTRKLLNHLKIKKQLFSCYEENEEKVKEVIAKFLNEKSNIALVSDRGTPVISDPGYKVVSHVIKAGYNVVCLPGPTALIPALVVSGIAPSPFLFYGFLNSKSEKKNKELEELKNLRYTIIFYEAPHRMEKTLIAISKILGNRYISISREISKKFEEVYYGLVKESIIEMKNKKGEFVIVVEGKKEINFDHLTIVEHINLYIKEGYSEMDAIKLVSKERKVAKNTIYKEYHVR